jgi:drug/metabolite transporter (DMT)-like permease
LRPTTRQLCILVVLTIVWGLNWPVMKVAVSGLPGLPLSFPPLSFRALCMVLGLPVLAAALLWLKVPFAVPRQHWKEVALLTLLNMAVWHVVIIVSLQQLSSGRSAILGYTMPVFVALWGRLAYGERLSGRQLIGVAAAALGVFLLLSGEWSAISGSPRAAAAVLVAAAVWAVGTYRLRHSTLPMHLLTIVFWMTASTAVLMVVLSLLVERAAWRAPEPHVWGAIVFNAVGVFGFAHAAWFHLARTMPPLASSISVMLIPVLGVFSGALFLGEALHWQDWTAVVLMVLAIALVVLKR